MTSCCDTSLHTAGTSMCMSELMFTLVFTQAACSRQSSPLQHSYVFGTPRPAPAFRQERSKFLYTCAYHHIMPHHLPIMLLCMMAHTRSSPWLHLHNLQCVFIQIPEKQGLSARFALCEGNAMRLQTLHKGLNGWHSLHDTT